MKFKSQIWTLPSNSGNQKCIWEVLDCNSIIDNEIIVVDITINTQYWDRVLLQNREYSDYVDDSRLKLNQMLLYKNKVNELTEDLYQWVNTPIEKLANTPFESEYELSGIDGQSLIMNFLHPKNNRTMLDQPELSLKYICGAIRGEVNFTIDPTSINVFLNAFEHHENS